VTAVPEFLETFKTWLALDDFYNAEWIRRQLVEMFLKKYSSEFWEARKKGRQGNMRPAMDLGECTGEKGKSNLPALPNTTFMVVIRWVSNAKDMVLAPK
jgi:hypothetical protein